MSGEDLDTRIREALPQVTVPARLAVHRASILADARQRRMRWFRVWVASAVASVVLVGGGSVAMAGAGLETPWGYIADNVFKITRTGGAECFQGIRVMWVGLAEDDPLVQDAKNIMRDMDLESLDTAAEEAEYRAANKEAAANDGWVQTDEEIKMAAVTSVAADTMFSELLARGYQWSGGHEVWVSTDSTECR